MKAKNVCLQLVDGHTSLARGGVVQLFTTPHPPRLTPSPYLGRSPPKLTQITHQEASKTYYIQLILPEDELVTLNNY